MSGVGSGWYGWEVRKVGRMHHREASSRGVALLALGWGLAAVLTACASETAAYHQRRAEDHVYIGSRHSFLDRAARLLSERGQSPQLLAANNTLQTRWVLVSGANPDPRHGVEPLVFQSYRVTVTSLDDLHHRIRIERGTVTTFQAPSRIEMQAEPVQTDSSVPGSQSGLPSIDPPVSSGVPVFVPDGELEWELLRRSNPGAAAIIDQEGPSGKHP